MAPRENLHTSSQDFPWGKHTSIIGQWSGKVVAMGDSSESSLSLSSSSWAAACLCLSQFRLTRLLPLPLVPQTSLIANAADFLKEYTFKMRLNCRCPLPPPFYKQTNGVYLSIRVQPSYALEVWATYTYMSP